MTKTILVTGANTGIGKATVEALAPSGDRIYLACRSEAKTQPVIDEISAASGNRGLHFLPLDLNSLASVRECAAAFIATGDPLHVLVNNAGVAGMRGITADGFELTFGVNHLGHFLLTNLLLDRIKASAPARIVNVSSVGHYQAKGIDWEAVRQPTAHVTAMHEYAVSKLANVLFTEELARRLDGTGVTTYALHPGAIASDIWERRMPGILKPPVALLTRLIMRSPAEGAKTSVWCATAPELANESGKYYDDCKEKAPSAVATPELAAELWRRSEAWTGSA
ncbi:MAG TPA: SDR family oxidoreductase [Acidimicrobiales bacterium]|nr:SDR family oxidoreductase [Acidimicrobiales bacterium]